MICFVKQGLWLRLLKLGATDDPLSSFEYGTILGMHLRFKIYLMKIYLVEWGFFGVLQITMYFLSFLQL